MFKRNFTLEANTPTELNVDSTLAPSKNLLRTADTGLHSLALFSFVKIVYAKRPGVAIAKGLIDSIG